MPKKQIVLIVMALFLSLFGEKAFCQTEPRLDDPVVPDSLLDNRAAAYQYYKAHYWENCQLDDSTLVGDLRFVKRICDFFDKVVAPLPDSLTSEIDRFVGQIPNKNVRDFALCLLLDKYEHPTYMTQDAVYVHLAEHYFLQDKDIKGLSETSYAHIDNQVKKNKRLALFQPAPELALRDAKGNHISIHSIESEWLVLFFYDHECDVCESEAQDLQQLSTQHPDLQVYAIDVNRKFLPFDNNFINVSAIQALGDDPIDTYDVSDTPMLYLLDRDKRIVGKRLSAKQIPILLN